ncbi:sensor histidine kinase [Streptomyces sp. NPDC051940]|uniref:sensor histidine kinase n=1 Tax=Streptomyces sp. NPDC051940 TaxID=3155675 RepID=UPI0034180AB7
MSPDVLPDAAARNPLGAGDGADRRAGSGAAVAGPRPDRHPRGLSQAEPLLRGALHGTFAALLVIAMIQSAASDARTLAPAAVLGAVYAAGVLRARGMRHGEDGGPAAGRSAGDGDDVRSAHAGAFGWLAAVSALWLLLLALDPAYSYLAFPLFFLYLHLLPGPLPSLTAVAGATLAVIASQAAAPGPLTPAMVVGPAAGATVAVLMSVGYAALYRESRARQQLIDDLVRTRDELAAAQREAGKLAERQRLAREIHDTLAQGLSSIVLLSRMSATGDESAVRARLAEIGETAAGNLDEARRFVHELTPPALADTPLPEALRRVAAAAPLDVAFRVEGEPAPLPVGAEVALLRLTQEALTNVSRHSGADRATVTLSFLAGQVALDVYDEGCGFDPATAGAGRFGLHGMRQRIAALGGTLTVESAPGEGTAVAAVLPLDGER